MATPFLLAETPRGGSFGHRFIMPPGTNLQSTDVEAFFQRAAQGGGSNFIAVNHQVEQHLPNGAVRRGAETLLLAGVKTSKMKKDQMQHIREALIKNLANLEDLVTREIEWEESGQQTVIIRKELSDWLRRDINDILGKPALPIPAPKSPPVSRQNQIGKLIGMLLGLAAGATILFIWFF